MRHFGNWAVLLAVTPLLALGATACSASSEFEDQPDPDQSQDGGVKPPPRDSGSDATVTPIVDSGHHDATLDAPGDAITDRPDADSGGANTDAQQDAPDPTDAPADAPADAPGDDAADTGADAADAAPDGNGPTGSACTPRNQIQKQPCGRCGYQERLCAPDTSGELVWQEWGFCQGEVVNGCMPGDSTPERCGLCGSRDRICQNDCTWAVGACLGQPAGACQPGKEDFHVGLSCDVGGRTRTCDNNCTWTSFGECFTPLPGVTIGRTAGLVTSGDFTMPATPTLTRLSTGTCPVTSFSTATSYVYVPINNTTSQTAIVSVWGSAPADGIERDTVMSAYNRPTAPVTDAERKACTGKVSDSCSAAPCTGGWGGLVAGEGSALTIPPNSSITIYAAMYFSGAGAIRINTKVESFL